MRDDLAQRTGLALRQCCERAYLQNHFGGQSLILENKSPVSPLPEGGREYFFGGTTTSTVRTGFYPLQS
jgi:hypothetical protein